MNWIRRTANVTNCVYNGVVHERRIIRLLDATDLCHYTFFHVALIYSSCFWYIVEGHYFNYPHSYRYLFVE